MSRQNTPSRLAFSGLFAGGTVLVICGMYILYAWNEEQERVKHRVNTRQVHDGGDDGDAKQD